MVVQRVWAIGMVSLLRAACGCTVSLGQSPYDAGGEPPAPVETSDQAPGSTADPTPSVSESDEPEGGLGSPRVSAADYSGSKWPAARTVGWAPDFSSRIDTL
jgi:hypothetical protein